MSKVYTTDDDEEIFMNETQAVLKKLTETYPEIKELAQVLLLIGGDTIVFDGWGEPKDIADLVKSGKIVEIEEISMEIVNEGEYECMVGYCWANTAEIVQEKPQFIPVYSFALNNYYNNIAFWMEHFILKNINNGKYYEATEVDNVIKYFAMDITKAKLMEMESKYTDYDIDD